MRATGPATLHDTWSSKHCRREARGGSCPQSPSGPGLLAQASILLPLTMFGALRTAEGGGLGWLAPIGLLAQAAGEGAPETPPPRVLGRLAPAL